MDWWRRLCTGFISISAVLKEHGGRRLKSDPLLLDID